MELRSMTGFGRGEAALRGARVDVEVSCVNRRQLDMRVNLPRGAAVLESRVHELIRAAVQRGAVSLSVRVEAAAGGGGVRVNESVAAAYLRQLRRLGRKLGVEGRVPMATLVTLPGVVECETASEDPEGAWPAIRKASESALSDLVQMRAREGAALKADLTRRLVRLGRFRKRIEGLSGQVTKRSRAALLDRLERAKVDVDAHDPALLREVAILADRSDISEELVRLGSHMEQMRSLLESGGAVGRTLDFVCQEMFREVNTIGSKCGDARITRDVVSFKSLLETVREQVQNLE